MSSTLAPMTVAPYAEPSGPEEVNFTGRVFESALRSSSVLMGEFAPTPRQKYSGLPARRRHSALRWSHSNLDVVGSFELSIKARYSEPIGSRRAELSLRCDLDRFAVFACSVRRIETNIPWSAILFPSKTCADSPATASTPRLRQPIVFGRCREFQRLADLDSLVTGAIHCGWFIARGISAR